MIDSESTCIMIGMAPFIWMCKDDLWLVSLQEMKDSARQLDQTNGSLLVRNFQALAIGGSEAGKTQGEAKLLRSGLAICRQRWKTIGSAVLFIPRSAIRYMNKMRRGEPS